jgi:hypothetical protein
MADRDVGKEIKDKTLYSLPSISPLLLFSPSSFSLLDIPPRSL